MRRMTGLTGDARGCVPGVREVLLTASAHVTGQTARRVLLRRAAKREDQIIVGFAAETETDRKRQLELGRQKISRKGADFLVLNKVGWNEGFATERNEITVLENGKDIVMEVAGSKLSVAHRILDVIAERL